MILDFNADWRFYKADGSCRTVHLPHDAMLEEPRQENCQNGKDCGYFPGGKYAYEKTFSLPGEHLNEALTFLFEGVYQNAVVYPVSYTHLDVYKRQGVYLAADTRRQAQFSEAAAEIQGSV